MAAWSRAEADGVLTLDDGEIEWHWPGEVHSRGLTEAELANHIHELRENGTSFYEISMTLPLDRDQVEELYEEYDRDELPQIKH